MRADPIPAACRQGHTHDSKGSARRCNVRSTRKPTTCSKGHTHPSKWHAQNCEGRAYDDPYADSGFPSGDNPTPFH